MIRVYDSQFKSNLNTTGLKGYSWTTSARTGQELDIPLELKDRARTSPHQTGNNLRVIVTGVLQDSFCSCSQSQDMNPSGKR